MLQLVEIFLFMLYAHRALWHVIQQYTIGFVADLWYLHFSYDAYRNGAAHKNLYSAQLMKSVAHLAQLAGIFN